MCLNEANKFIIVFNQILCLKLNISNKYIKRSCHSLLSSISQYTERKLTLQLLLCDTKKHQIRKYLSLLAVMLIKFV
jgi:hypothetical protein